MQTITFWKQPGGQTWKRMDSDGSKHVSPDAAFAEMQHLRENQWLIVDHGIKVECIANPG